MQAKESIQIRVTYLGKNVKDIANLYIFSAQKSSNHDHFQDLPGHVGEEALKRISGIIYFDASVHCKEIVKL